MMTDLNPDAIDPDKVVSWDEVKEAWAAQAESEGSPLKSSVTGPLETALADAIADGSIKAFGKQGHTGPEEPRFYRAGDVVQLAEDAGLIEEPTSVMALWKPTSYETLLEAVHEVRDYQPSLEKGVLKPVTASAAATPSPGPKSNMRLTAAP